MFMNRNASRGRNKGIRRVALLCLSVLLFWGGWSVIASVRFLMTAMGVSLGTALSIFFQNIDLFFTSFFSGKSLLIGTILGLLMFSRLRNRNAEETAEEETAEEVKKSVPEEEEEEIIESTHYRYH